MSATKARGQRRTTIAPAMSILRGKRAARSGGSAAMLSDRRQLTGLATCMVCWIGRFHTHGGHMAKSKSKTPAAHRVIGIRYTLKALKRAGLVESDSMFPMQAVDDVRAAALGIAENWYWIGAKRGALEIIEAFLDGNFEIGIDKKGKREVIASTKKVLWEKRLSVTVGNGKHVVPKREYALAVDDDLGFA
jgi:hypothetical protein